MEQVKKELKKLLDETFGVYVNVRNNESVPLNPTTELDQELIQAKKELEEGLTPLEDKFKKFKRKIDKYQITFEIKKLQEDLNSD